MANPKQAKGLVPAKNEDKIGIANPESKKFYQLDYAFLNIWLLCNGKRSEDEVCSDFVKFLKENVKSGADAKIDEKKIKEDVKSIINKLRKFALLE